MQVLCWRTVPTNNGSIGEVARSSEPFMRQVFLVPTAPFQEDDLKKQVSLMHVIDWVKHLYVLIWLTIFLGLNKNLRAGQS